MLRCKNCGFSIDVNESSENFACEACGTVWTLAELEEYEQNIQNTKNKIAQEFERKRQQEEDEKQRKKDLEHEKEMSKMRVEETKAQAEVIRAQNSGKPQTVIINGVDVNGIVDNAVASFVAKDFSSAVKGATEVLGSDKENLSAGFIVSFNEHVFNKKMHQLDGFFAKVPTLPGTIPAEEMNKLCQLFVSGRLKLADYEAKILQLVYANANEMGPAAVCKFVDEFSPNIIASRGNGSFLTGELLDAYMKLSAFCAIPKTCFALLGAIDTNPASPLKNGEYYLKGKSKKFFDEYVTHVGEVIDVMRSEKNRPQFQKAFADKSRNYCQKTGI